MEVVFCLYRGSAQFVLSSSGRSSCTGWGSEASESIIPGAERPRLSGARLSCSILPRLLVQVPGRVGLEFDPSLLMALEMGVRLSFKGADRCRSTVSGGSNRLTEVNSHIRKPARVNVSTFNYQTSSPMTCARRYLNRHRQTLRIATPSILPSKTQSDTNIERGMRLPQRQTLRGPQLGLGKIPQTYGLVEGRLVIFRVRSALLAPSPRDIITLQSTGTFLTHR